MIIGVISDTHGLLRPEAVEALRGSELILHAGDIGKPEILRELTVLAPTVAVRGNNDVGDWAENLPDIETLPVGEHRIHLLHDLKALSIDPVAEGVAVVISGHSHKPSIETRNGVLYLNPGSAGPRRFKLPVSVARLRRRKAGFEAELLKLT
ncbi:MAG: metallophosphatase family protein [Gammaproteobacteria bacterium]|nr:metallophosphatase family protein [Gammaproteobacteria bacterium]